MGIVTERDLGLLTERLRDMGFVENIDGGGDELVDDDEAGGFNLRSAALLGRPQPQVKKKKPNLFINFEQWLCFFSLSLVHVLNLVHNFKNIKIKLKLYVFIYLLVKGIGYDETCLS